MDFLSRLDFGKKKRSRKLWTNNALKAIIGAFLYTRFQNAEVNFRGALCPTPPGINCRCHWNNKCEGTNCILLSARLDLCV